MTHSVATFVNLVSNLRIIYFRILCH